MGAGHSHGATTPSGTAAGRHKTRLMGALALTTIFMAVEVVGGLWTGSLALLADAAHMLTDAGGLALALCMAIRGAGLPLPAGVFAACPYSDLTLSGHSLEEFEGLDPAANREMLSYLAASYFQGHEPTDAMVSPLFGDFRGLPPLLMVAATNEALRDDTTRLAERAKADGADVTLHLVDDSVHVFPLFNFLPEAEAAMAQLRDWTHRVIPHIHS